MNKGFIKDNIFYKEVSFNSAVLWKDKQLSLPPDVYSKAVVCEKIVFRDLKKGEEWVFDPKDIQRTSVLKKVGQELQYYFPIILAKKVKIQQKGAKNAL
jgi:hypothetical protein